MARTAKANYSHNSIIEVVQYTYDDGRPNGFFVLGKFKGFTDAMRISGYRARKIKRDLRLNLIKRV